jgi:hypothetical protein
VKISELLSRLEKIKAARGDIDVRVEVCFHCGPYGEYNCEAESDLQEIYDKTGKEIILSGWGSMRY